MKKKRKLDKKDLETLEKIDSAMIATAIDSLDVRDRTAGFSSLKLRCFYPELSPIVGYAITCSEDTTTPRRGPRAGYADLLRAIRAAPKPAILVFKAVGQDWTRSCHVGDMMCSLLQRMGVVAVVTDGAVRDINAIQSSAPGFQLFGAGTVPGAGAYTMLDVGITTSIFGLTIAPGDLLHGDANGLVSIPFEIVSKLPGRVKKIRKYENEFRKFSRSSEFTLTEMSKRFGPPWG